MAESILDNSPSIYDVAQAYVTLGNRVHGLNKLVQEKLGNEFSPKSCQNFRSRTNSREQSRERSSIFLKH